MKEKKLYQRWYKNWKYRNETPYFYHYEERTKSTCVWNGGWWVWRDEVVPAHKRELVCRWGPKIWCIDNDFFYCLQYGYFRSIQTFPERRDNDFFDTHDEDRKMYRIKFRRARSSGMIPNSWDDIHVSREGGKSWKDYSKCRKQWMVNL